MKMDSRLLEIRLGHRWPPIRMPRFFFFVSFFAPGESSSYSGLNHGEMVALENMKHSLPDVPNISIIGRDVFVFLQDKDGKISVRMMQGD